MAPHPALRPKNYLDPKRAKPADIHGAKALCIPVGNDSLLQQNLEDLAQLLAKETKLLPRLSTKTNSSAEATHLRKQLHNVAQHLPKALRPLHAFRSKSHNPYRQLTALLAHLFEKYPTPEFLHNAFASGNETEIDLYFHIAHGGNVRKFQTSHSRLGPKLTKAQAHIFHTTTNSNLTVSQAFLNAQALSHNVNPGLIPEILNALCTPIADWQDPRWEAFFEFLGRQNMVDKDQIGPLIDYLRHEFLHSKEYTFKGRTLAALLNHMEAWHKDLQRKKLNKNRSWEPSKSLHPYFSNPDDHQLSEWTITEITTEKGLHKEGKDMHHCVYSYTTSCLNGLCSIWSLTHFDQISGNRKKIATLEVRDKSLVQARGKFNALLLPNEKQVLALWAKQEGLALRC